MNQSSIEAYVDTQPSAVKEVFSSIVTNPSPSTRNAAIQVANKFSEKLNDSLFSSSQGYLREIDVESFIAFATEFSFKQEQTLSYKVFKKHFKKLWLWICCFLFDLNFKQLHKLMKEKSEVYYQVGDGIMLAGVYLTFEE